MQGYCRSLSEIALCVSYSVYPLADKTGLCFETGPAGMLMPRGQVTTIAKAYPAPGWESMVDATV